jgi:myb proto-oncogene protein
MEAPSIANVEPLDEPGAAAAEPAVPVVVPLLSVAEAGSSSTEPGALLVPAEVVAVADPEYGEEAGGTLALIPEGRGSKKNAWSPEEDLQLQEIVAQDGKGHWTKIAEKLPGRAGRQCRERWFNHLAPDVRKGSWTADEDRAIVAAVREHGTKWSTIQKQLPGRSDNSIKNRYYSAIRKAQRLEKRAVAGATVPNAVYVQATVGAVPGADGGAAMLPMPAAGAEEGMAGAGVVMAAIAGCAGAGMGAAVSIPPGTSPGPADGACAVPVVVPLAGVPLGAIAVPAVMAGENAVDGAGAEAIQEAMRYAAADAAAKGIDMRHSGHPTQEVTVTAYAEPAGGANESGTPVAVAAVAVAADAPPAEGADVRAESAAAPVQ